MGFNTLCVSETIIEPADINEANELMPKLLEIGMLGSDHLQTFRNVFQHVCDWIKDTKQQICSMLNITFNELPKI